MAEPSPRSTPAVAVIRKGTGPEVMLVHGGASPETTWKGLESLTERWTLAYVYRRGYPPSPEPPGGRQDFELDAADLLALLEGRPHLVAHSYGGPAAAIAAVQNPVGVRSLTLVEPAIFPPSDDPEVTAFRRLGDTVMAKGLDTDPSELRRFLRLAGAPVPDGDDAPLPPEVVRGVRRAHGGRPPSEADPPLGSLREAGVPSLVASGAHYPAIERTCDAVAAALGAHRVVCPGAGHFVAAAPGFADELERFLRSVPD
jgi:pimeloyl-ACP methyl ester carboxylesterase